MNTAPEKPLDLKAFKEAAADLAAYEKNPSPGRDAETNLACWLGERAHHLIDEIERLAAERDFAFKTLALSAPGKPRGDETDDELIAFGRDLSGVDRHPRTRKAIK